MAVFIHSFYKDKLRKHIVFSALSLVFFLFFVSASVANDFVVENVRVDVTASNAVEAREQAFEAAQIKAYEKLASRLLSPEELENFETPSLNKISALVRNFEVTNEQLSSVRYNGTYTIQFRPHALGNSMAQSQISDRDPSTVESQASILVIPVIQKDGVRYVWSRGTYRDAWIQAVANDPSNKIILPVGDSNDREMLRDSEALNYDYFRLDRMIKKYQADKAVIVITDPQAAQSTDQNVLVSLYEALPNGPRFMQQIDVPAYPGEMPSQLFTRVVSQSKIALENQTTTKIAKQPELPKQQAPVSGPARSLTAQLGFSSVREWIDLKRAIEKTRGVSAIIIKSMSARNAVVDISYRGDEMALSNNMRQMRVSLQPPPPYSASYGQPQLYTITKLR